MDCQKTCRLMWLMVCVGLFGCASIGCCNGYVCSHRFAETVPSLESEGSYGANACGDSCAGCARCRRGIGVRNELAENQATIQPPCPRYHPVPTRPVFEARPQYAPLEPLHMHASSTPHEPSMLTATPTHEVPVARPMPAMNRHSFPSENRSAMAQPRILKPTPAVRREEVLESPTTDEPSLNRPQNYERANQATSLGTTTGSARLVSAKVR